jgi:hypothetical protein
MLAGSPNCRVVASMAATAWPREAPEARLNDRVTAGNCPWRVMASGAVVASTCVTALRGTPCVVLVPRT